jgi:[ribosomal protein S5]-alanine N-acetyltransferase
MELETNRLILKTVDLDLLDAAAQNSASAIEALGYHTNGEWPGPDFADALPYFRKLLVENKGTRGFDSWIILLRDTMEIAGGIGFMGNPDEEGSIEIGFATNESFRRRGIGFEAAKLLIDWALGHDEVDCIIARCKANNVASKNLLLKLRFETDRVDGELLRWKLVVNKPSEPRNI